jgi:hypothetical protein
MRLFNIELIILIDKLVPLQLIFLLSIPDYELHKL